MRERERLRVVTEILRLRDGSEIVDCEKGERVSDWENEESKREKKEVMVNFLFNQAFNIMKLTFCYLLTYLCAVHQISILSKCHDNNKSMAHYAIAVSLVVGLKDKLSLLQIESALQMSALAMEGGHCTLVR